MSLQVWLPLNKDPNMTPEIVSYRKESGVTLTEDTDGWYKVQDTTHASGSRWGIYYDFAVKPNTTYTLYVYSKSTTGIKASINIQSFAVVTWPTQRDTNTTSDEKLTTYSWTTGPSDSIARVYLALITTSTKANDYVFYKEPRVYEAPQNQGIANTNITENGAIYQSNAGKLGGCFKTTSNAHIDLKYNGDQVNTGSISFGGWFNFNKNELQERFSTYTYTDVRTTPTGNIIGNNSYGGVGLIWYTNNMYNTNGILNNLYITCSIRSTNNGARATSGREIPFNTWVHLFLIFNKITKELQLWINGELVQYSIMLDFDDARSQNLMLNYNAVWGGNGPSFNIPFLVNDVRIYDHALSVQEIKELARGLVLHYPLNNNGFGNENLILSSHSVTSGGNANGITSSYELDGSLKVISTSGNGNYRSVLFAADSKSNVAAKLSAGDAYSISVDVKVASGTKLPTLFINTNNGYKQLQGDIKLNKWIRAYYSGIWVTPASDSYGSIHLHLGFSNAIGTYYFKNFKLEKSPKPTPWSPAPSDALAMTMGMNNSIAYDISGFQNNGTITGAQSTLTDTVRYNVATYFDGASYIVTDYYSNLGTGDFTISAWIKLELNSSKTYQPIIINKGTGAASVGCGIYFNHNQNKFLWSTADGFAATEVWTANTFADIYDKWTHVVMVRNSSDSKKGYFYIDGTRVELASVPAIRDVSNSTYPMVIGAIGPHNYSTYQWTGGISDVRLYTTALSAADIQELYKMGREVN